MWKKVVAFGCLGLVLLLIAGVVGLCVLEYSIHRDEINFRGNVEKQIDPVELQKWAVERLKLGDGTILSKDQMPAYLRKIGSFGPEFATVSNDSESMPAIQIFWGSGFGHWGLIIGDKSFKTSGDKEEVVTPWVAGVYFFDGD